MVMWKNFVKSRLIKLKYIRWGRRRSDKWRIYRINRNWVWGR